MRAVSFAPEIEADLYEAVAWFNEQGPDLAGRFLTEFRSTVDRIARIGSALRKAHGEFRHLKFEGFSYFVYFRDDGAGFYVTLLIDGSRDPALVLRLLQARR